MGFQFFSADGRRVLNELEVEVRGAVPAEGTLILDGRKGREVKQIPPHPKLPTLFLHRADLVDALWGAAARAGVRFRFGHETSLAEMKGEAAEGRIVVAADGVRSAARQWVDGPSQAQFTGQVAWRATVPSDATDAMARLWMGPGMHVVSYPIRNGHLTNIVAVEERRDWTEEGWSIPGDPEEFQSRFKWFGGDLEPLLASVTEVHRWALFLHPVAQRWSRDRLCLLGDAAHPTLPFMAQGANLALEDAALLARALKDEPRVEDAFARYQHKRRDRAVRIVAEARKNAFRFHLRGPLRPLGQMVLRRAGGLVSPDLTWIYDYDATGA